MVQSLCRSQMSSFCVYRAGGNNSRLWKRRSMSSERTSLAPMLLTGSGQKDWQSYIKGTVQPDQMGLRVVPWKRSWLCFKMFNFYLEFYPSSKFKAAYNPPIIGKTACMCASRHYSDKPISKMCEPDIFFVCRAVSYEGWKDGFVDFFIK